MLLFWTIYKRILEKINKQQNSFKKQQQKIWILEWFLKDHVTLKTGVTKNKLSYIWKIYLTV